LYSNSELEVETEAGKFKHFSSINFYKTTQVFLINTWRGVSRERYINIR